MKQLLILSLLFVSCSPLRHYKKVALDPYRNNAEKQLLSKACSEEFPTKLDSPKVSVTIDSAAYNEAVAAYNELLDQYIKLAENDTARGTTTVVNQVLYRCTPRDSLRIIKQFLSTYRPKPIIEVRDRTVYVENSQKTFAAEQKLKECDQENENLTSDLKKKTSSLKGWRTATFVLGGSLLLLLILLILYLTGKIGKRV